MYMKLKDGKSKVLTLSYDDGVVQDIRLMEILNQHGIKATFNINTGLYTPEDLQRETFCGRMKLSEAQALYTDSGHEVAVHGCTHPFMNRLSSPALVNELMEDRRNIAAQYGTLARGMAYPYNAYSDEVLEAARVCGICYGRTVQDTCNFWFPENWLTWHPTCYHNNPRLFELTQSFVQAEVPWHECRLFYLWGHSYEFDDDNNWDLIERFAAEAGDKEDIWYATNIEIYDYVTAYRSLQVDANEHIVHNPSAIDVWFAKDDTTYCVHSGETVRV